MGLSVKWANFNVGAFHPTHCGDYFAWGEIDTKEIYGWSNYKWCKGTEATITKYNRADGLITLLPEDDAAYVHWGEKWRMPTRGEMNELYTTSTWTEETCNGIKGHMVTGPNGNSIFIPIAGWYNYDLCGKELQRSEITTYYWTSTLSSNVNAYDLVFRSVNGVKDGIANNTRRCGFPIRPVCEP
jgi:hypothetical protein